LAANAPSFGLGDLAPLSQRFIRCHHCGLPHNITDEVCPITGKPIRKRAKKADAKHAKSEEGSGPHAVPIPLVSHRRAAADRRAGKPTASNRDDAERLLGRIVGAKYRVLHLIGEGGMGNVFEAEHLEIGQHVAIKVLNRAHLGRKEAVARFHQEARAAGAIGHPNICEIYDVGRLDDGAPYLVMERLHGKTLSDRINIEGALPFEDVVAILTQVLSALVAAHEKGIIHRDIKPENIFLTERVGCAPVVKILDFGISKSASDNGDLSLTRTGMVMGTPYYMAPEQARGEPIDHRVDIYACGVILYETLTGRRPFLASNYHALVVQVLSAEPKDPREVRPAIPDGFVPIIGKALSKKRDERYADAAQFIDELSDMQSELERGPSNKEIRRLAEQVRQSTCPPPAIPFQDDMSSDSTDIPVVFSETGTGQQAASTGTGEVDVNLDTGSRTEEPDPTVIGDGLSFDTETGPVGVAAEADVDPGAKDAEDVHDTIVDPTGAMLGEVLSELERAKAAGSGELPDEAESTVRTDQLDRETAGKLLDAVDGPGGGTTDADGTGEVGGRYAMISTYPEGDEDELDDKTTERPSRSRVPRPTAGAHAPRPPRPNTPRPAPASVAAEPEAHADDPDDDAVTTLFVSSDDGPREARSRDEQRGSAPEIPRPPGTRRI